MAEKKNTAAVPPKLRVPLARQQSYTTISKLIEESMSRPQSPLTPSPEGAAEVRSILQRLENVEIESRDLLTKLFSLVKTDARLERYIRRQLEDPRVSGMWALIEQILAGVEAGKIDIDKMLDEENSDQLGCSSKSAKVTDESGGDDGMRDEWIKGRAFNMDEVSVRPVPPPDQIVESEHPIDSGRVSECCIC